MRHLPDYGVPLKPVGRLDMDTEGLLLCTNDGELHARLSHPRYGIEKEYYAIVEGQLRTSVPSGMLRDGVFIEGPQDRAREGRSGPRRAPLHLAPKITIHEGRYRQIRFMGDAVGHKVLSLKRTRYGPFLLKGMRPGEAILLGQEGLGRPSQVSSACRLRPSASPLNSVAVGVRLSVSSKARTGRMEVRMGAGWFAGRCSPLRTTSKSCGSSCKRSWTILGR